MQGDDPDNLNLSANVVRAAEAWLEEHDSLARLAPYFGKVVQAYGWVRQRRMHAFLLAMDYEVAKNGPEARKRLDDLISSRPGADLLADYADATLRTASKTASIGLAVLYTDTDHSAYPESFKPKACSALSGLTEPAVKAYQFLVKAGPDEQVNREDPGPFPVYSLDSLARRLGDLAEVLPTRADQLLTLADLQRRSMLLPDHSLRFSSGDLYFGVPDDAALFSRLLARAEALRSEHPALDAV